MSTMNIENQSLEKSNSILQMSNTSYFLDIDNFLINFLDGSKLNLFCHPLSAFLKKVLREKEVNAFLLKHKDLEGIEFTEKIFDYLNFGFTISFRDRQKIPSTGRVIIVSNQPLGSLDGLSLLSMVKEIRPDVMIQSNEILSNIPQIKKSVLTKPQKDQNQKNLNFNFDEAIEALQNEMAVIIFPAGKVSKWQWNGIKDSRWGKAFLRLSINTQSPILPVHIQGRNSAFYYGLANFTKSPGPIVLVNEMFKQVNQEIRLRIGELIPFTEIRHHFKNYKEAAFAFKNQVYAIASAQKTKPLDRLKTLEVVMAPIDIRVICQELKDSHLLKKVSNNRIVYLFNSFSESYLMNEIGRLREIVFRQVNEGTGKKLDVDKFDKYYRHIILWDKEELVVMGSYRIGEAFKIVPEKGFQGLYTNTLFEYTFCANIFFNKGLELGRSFMQSAYWGKRGLDFLWMGIGSYLNSSPQIRYLFGPVSISSAYPKKAKDLIVGFYQNYFIYDKDSNYAKARNPYFCSAEILNYIAKEYSKTREEATKQLKSDLQILNVQIPPLFKLYTELCNFEGIRFLGFNIDHDFHDSIDGLIVLDLNYLKDTFRNRYINSADSTESEAK